MKKVMISIMLIVVTFMFFACVTPVKFKLIVTFNNGTVTANGTTLTSGTSVEFIENEDVTLQGTPTTNYAFVKFVINGSDVTDNPTTLTMDSDKTVETIFEPKSWIYVGSAGISNAEGAFSNIAIDSDGILYVAYADQINDWKASVKKFNGTSWEFVGAEAFTSPYVWTAEDTSFAIDSNDNLYIAFNDSTNDNKARVMTFNGTEWVNVGSNGFSTGEAHCISIAIDSNDNLYVGYRDSSTIYKETVKKFNGTTWNLVGPDGFTSGGAYASVLAIDGNDTLYVAYSDYNVNDSKATVMKYNGSSWELVGVAGFSAGAIGWPDLAFDSNNTPYITYTDESLISTSGSHGRLVVMKYNGTSWELVGEAGLSEGISTEMSIAFDSNDIPYIAFQDIGMDNKLRVIRFNNTAWESVGPVTITTLNANFPSLVFDNNDVPYVAFVDKTVNNAVSVIKYD